MQNKKIIIKKVFKNFEENCGWKSIIKFVEYVNSFECKTNQKLINNLVSEFNELNNALLIKNFANFKKYCLSK